MLRVEIVTPDCAEDEVYSHQFPDNTHLEHILVYCNLQYPDATEIHFYLEDEE